MKINLKRKSLLLFGTIVGIIALNFSITGLIGTNLLGRAMTSIYHLIVGDQLLEVKKVYIESSTYDSNTPGSWQIEKSADWTGINTAKVTLEVDTIRKTTEESKDVIFVLDISGSMSENKLTKVKEDTKELTEYLLKDKDNEVALITFASESNIVSDFTNDKSTIIDSIDALTAAGTTNYNQALINANKVLENYQRADNRGVILLFLTDGYPNQETPNEVAQYQILKDRHPYLTIHAVQYEMGVDIVNAIKVMSDEQFHADMKTLENVLFDAGVESIRYEEFEVIDYIDSEFFEIVSKDDIKVSLGNVELIDEKGKQKVIWTVAPETFRSGSSMKMEINLKLKDKYQNNEGYYPTNEKEEITSKLPEEDEEHIESEKTPILKKGYTVYYNGNYPDECNQIYNDKIVYSAFEIVDIKDHLDSCNGYIFKGWQIKEHVEQYNDETFVMPSNDVHIIGTWGKVEISKSMDGVVSETDRMMQAVGSSSYKEKLWGYKTNITKVVFQNKMNPIEGAKSWDISAAGDGSVMAYYDPTTTTAYIQSIGKIVANPDSSFLFYDFWNLIEIEGLEYLDTSKVTTMKHMFSSCKKLTNLDGISGWNTSNLTNTNNMFYQAWTLTSLDLNNWDMSKVTDMTKMFQSCSGLKDLKISNWNTSSVITMEAMFSGCSGLTNLDLSKWNTSNVNSMYQMFNSCSRLVSLDLTGWDTSNVTTMVSMLASCVNLKDLKGIEDFNTSKVTTMSNMFQGDSSLTTLDLSKWDTSNVTTMQTMFSGCSSLTNINVDNFNTSKVTSMSSMFYGCSNLESIDVSHFDTSSITTMQSMFYNCKKLTSIGKKEWNIVNATNMRTIFNDDINLTATLNILASPSDYYRIFYNAATEPDAKITVNYTKDNVSIVDGMIATKSLTSNVIKGKQIG